jgi:hypothetical protein
MSSRLERIRVAVRCNSEPKDNASGRGDGLIPTSLPGVDLQARMPPRSEEVVAQDLAARQRKRI